MPERTDYKHGEFCWVDLVSTDMVAAKTFYGNVFDWTCQDLDTQGGPPYGQFELGGKGVSGIGQLSDEMKTQGIPPHWNNYINVDDVDAIAKKAESLGAKVVMPPYKILEAGWMTYITDPTGAAVGFWQRNQHYGAQLVNDPGAFCWNELATPDIEGSKQFFGELLGWECVDNPNPKTKYYIIKNKGTENGGMIQMTAEWEGVPPHWMAYFATADIQNTVNKMTENGGKICVPPFDIPIGKICVGNDPQGATFSLFQPAA